MTYQLVKIVNPEKECKSFAIVLILSFCVFLLLNKVLTRFEYFDQSKLINKNKDKNKDKNKNKNKNLIKPILSSYNIGKCSKNCCATQWPVPIDLMEKSKIKKSDVGPGKKYSTSNLTCNNGVINTGCVCLGNESKNLFGNRGYVKSLPQGNGLLDQDYRKSAFKIMEDKVQPAKVLGQTEELTGRKSDSDSLHGKNINKFDIRLDSYRSVSDAKELAKNYSMSINNNMISFDNVAINNSLNQSNISSNEISDLNIFMKDRLGMNTQNTSVSRK